MWTLFDWRSIPTGLVSPRVKSQDLHEDCPLTIEMLDAWYDGTVWVCIEPEIGVICVCLPVMRPVILAALPQRARLTIQSKTGRLFRGARLTRNNGTLVTSSSFRSGAKQGNDTLGNRPFVRLEGIDLPLHDLGSVNHAEAHAEIQVLGSGAQREASNDELIGLDGILKRTDVELQYERQKDWPITEP